MRRLNCSTSGVIEVAQGGYLKLPRMRKIWLETTVGLRGYFVGYR
jgi:hypothetical protein